MTLAALKRSMPVGARVHIENHRYPQHTREAVVVKAQTKSFAVTHPRAPQGSWLQWPAAADVRFHDDGRATLLEDGEPIVTLTILPGGAG